MKTLEVYPGEALHATDAGDVFSAACGLYWFCADYHEGQGSEKYRILSQLDYKPSFSERGPGECFAAQLVYQALEAGDVDASDVFDFVQKGIAHE
jgi:hypothetical protein